MTHIPAKFIQKTGKFVLTYVPEKQGFLLTFLVLLVLINTCGLRDAQAQDLRFSQYYSAPLFLNPALTGIEKDIYFGLNYRIQSQANLSYETGQLSFIHPVYLKGQENRHIGGLGFTAVNEKAGEYGEVKGYGIKLSGAYNIKLSTFGTHYMSIGVQGSWLQNKIDFGQLNWPSQMTYRGFDHSIAPPEEFNEQFNMLGVNAGAMWIYNSNKKRYDIENNYKLYAGFAASHINQPKNSLIRNGDSKESILYKAHGGGEFDINEKIKVSPNLLVMRKDQFYQYNLGTSVNYENVIKNSEKATINRVSLHAGIWYRYGDSFIFLIGASNPTFNAAISYDINASTSRINIPGQGALEISLAYKISRDRGLKRFSTPLF